AEPAISENVNRHEIQMHSLSSLPMDACSTVFIPRVSTKSIALSHWRTFAVQKGMSALSPKADIRA
ncbi:MAG: hypothetical protein WBW13_07870, partial [Pseudolabrys sp.]